MRDEEKEYYTVDNMIDERNMFDEHLYLALLLLMLACKKNENDIVGIFDLFAEEENISLNIIVEILEASKNCIKADNWTIVTQEFIKDVSFIKNNDLLQDIETLQTLFCLKLL